MSKRSKSHSSVPPDTPSLVDVCRRNTALSPYFERGLGALEKADRRHIIVPDTSRIEGSIALDKAAARQYPHENRWDYLIEYGPNPFFIEIHPGSTSEIECMIKKVVFVKQWLNQICPEILLITESYSPSQNFYWVSSGNTDLRLAPGSKHSKRLALHKIVNVGQTWYYSKIAKK